MQRMGVSYVRNEIKWAWVEKQKGVYAVAKNVKKWINMVLEAGIKVAVKD